MKETSVLGSFATNVNITRNLIVYTPKRKGIKSASPPANHAFKWVELPAVKVYKTRITDNIVSGFEGFGFMTHAGPCQKASKTPWVSPKSSLIQGDFVFANNEAHSGLLGINLFTWDKKCAGL
jgi:hypothetical protein